jgi:hypothetical protein
VGSLSGMALSWLLHTRTRGNWLSGIKVGVGVNVGVGVAVGLIGLRMIGKCMSPGIVGVGDEVGVGVIVGEGVTVGVGLAAMKGLLVGRPILSEVEIERGIAADPFEYMKPRNTSKPSIGPIKIAMRFFIARDSRPN